MVVAIFAVVNYVYEVGVAYLIGQSGFLVESRYDVGREVVGVGQQFERDVSVAQRVADAINRAIASGADFAQDSVSADCFAHDHRSFPLVLSKGF